MTIIETVMAEGEVKGTLKASRAILLRLLRKRFGKVPRQTTAAIEDCTDGAQLNLWLDRVLEAPSLADMGITA